LVEQDEVRIETRRRPRSVPEG